jgi:hypothetical protein
VLYDAVKALNEDVVTSEPVLPTFNANDAVKAYEALSAGLALVNVEPVIYDAVVANDALAAIDAVAANELLTALEALTANDAVVANDDVPANEEDVLIIKVLNAPCVNALAVKVFMLAVKALNDDVNTALAVNVLNEAVVITLAVNTFILAVKVLILAVNALNDDVVTTLLV